MSLVQFIGVYFLGALTFIPSLLFVFIYLHPKLEESPEPATLKAGEIEEKSQSGLDSFKQGWLVVTNEFLESSDEITSRTESVAESSDGKNAYASLYKLAKNNPKSDSSDSVDSSLSTGHSPSLSTEGAPLAAKKFSGSKRHRYYAVLKHGNLFLYKNEKLKDVKQVIVLQHHVVTLWPPSLSEGSLFTKHSSIAILKSDWTRARRLSDDLGDTAWGGSKKLSISDVLDPKSNLPAPPGSFFVYTDLNIDKEDWYFTLIRATKAGLSFPKSINPRIFAKTLHYETANMMSLIQSLYSSEGQLQTKWLNALIGRLFLSLLKTDVMKNYLISRLEKKLNKLKMPGFLDKFQITKVDAGNSAPLITYPALKEINPSGELLISLDLHYFGDFAFQISTKANINLGSRFKTRDVDLSLSIKLEKIEGPMLLKVKPPPSSRIWYTYEREPNMSIKIEPIISSRQMSYTIITSSIEKMMKEAVRDSLVSPHWDDIIFYYTEDELFRGGVWDKEARKSQEDEYIAPKTPATTGSNAEKESISKPRTTSDDFLFITTIDDTESIRLNSSSLLEMSPSKNLKPSLSATLNDLTKRLRKPKSGHTIGIDETNCLSDGSVVETARGLITSGSETSDNGLKETRSTLQKLGNWYARFDKSDDSKAAAAATSSASTYHPPEMISIRRGRKQSSASMASSEIEKDVSRGQFDFGSKYQDSELISRSLDFTTHDIRIEPQVDLATPSISPEELIAARFELNQPLSEEPGLRLAQTEPPNLVSKKSSQRKPPPDEISEESVFEE